MKRSEFVLGITTWEELREFCDDYQCEILDDVYDWDAFQEEVEEDVANRECGWTGLRDALNDVPDDGSYFERRGWLDYICVDDEFDYWKERVLDDCDFYDDFWEAEDDGEDEYEDEEVDDQDDSQESEPLDIGTVLEICQTSFQFLSK